MRAANAVFQEEEGQGMVEYALIIGLIAIMMISSLTIFSDGLIGLFSNITEKIIGIF